MSEVVSAKMASVLLLLMGLVGAGQTFAAVCQMCDNQWICREFGDVRICAKILVCKETPCVNQN